MNAFAGRVRLDKLNLQGPSEIAGVRVDVVSGISPERTIGGEVIKDALGQYLYFGLGKHGGKRDGSEFWSACEFLFNVRASKPETWQDARIMRDSYREKGKRVTLELELSDEELRAMCLDSIWDHLSFPMSLDAFIDDLQAERKAVLQENWQQVAAYLNLHQDYSECETALVAPETPDVLTDVLHSTRATEMAVAA